MASPQKEDGYTPIANELLDAIYRTNFTAAELKVLLFVMRFTYGFSRKEYGISLTFISNGVGVSKRYISSSVAKLIDDNILLLVKKHSDTQSRVIKINKDFDKWKNRTTIQQMNYSSTVESENNTTDELQFNTTDELQFNQDKQILKQNIKQDICDFQNVIDLFHSICISYSKITKLSEARKRTIKSRLKKYTINDFKKLFTMAEESSFLKGEIESKDERNWKANFDWLINETNMVKVIEGNYKNKIQQPKPVQTKQNSFNQFPQRTYSAQDYADLERKLINKGL